VLSRNFARSFSSYAHNENPNLSEEFDVSSASVRARRVPARVGVGLGWVGEVGWVGDIGPKSCGSGAEGDRSRGWMGGLAAIY